MLTFFFSPLGRIHQYVFTLGWMFWLAVELASYCGFAAAKPGSLSNSFWFIAMTATAGLSMVSVALLGMKRLRDAALPIWPAVMLLVPGLSLIGVIVLSNIPTRTTTSIK